MCNKKILYVFMDFPAPSEAFGAVEVKSMQKNKVEVYVASLFSTFKRESVEAIYGEILYPNPVHLSKSFFSLLIRPKFFFRYLIFLLSVCKTVKEFLKALVITPRVVHVCRFIEKKEFDGVHLFWGHYPSILIYFLRGRGFKGKISIFTGAYDLTSMNGLMQWGVNKADVVFTHCKHNVDKISSFFQGEINVLYRGIDCNDGHSPCQRDFNKSPVNFVYSGRLIESKKPENAIKVFKKLNEIHSDSFLHIFGDGALKDKLKKIIVEEGLEGKVVMHGHVSHDIMFEVFKQCHFLLFPSEHPSERLPNVVKESMNLGCVPVVSNTPGIEELVEDEALGLIVNFKNTEEVVEQVSYILGDFLKWSDMSENSRAFVRANFDNDVISKKRLELIFEGDA